MKLILQRFGKYLLLDNLVDGGMAKIFRAQFLSEDAQRLVAIKMIKPQFSMDEQFKSMFINEIKLAFSLNHPNIVQMYDYGLMENQLFVAMEYCDGKNLKQYLDKMTQAEALFPVPVALTIIAQAAQALDYAHQLTNKLSGQPLNIIHRDISPHNIMLSFDGHVKVIDFGIAKAESSADATQAGTLKGKLSYMAPEYLEGKPLESKYDQFALGITLWELLSGKKLFHAPNDLGVLKLIQACEIPSLRLIHPEVSLELEKLISKILSRQPEYRFVCCGELSRQLTRFVQTYYPDFQSHDLKKFSEKLFAHEIDEDRKILKEMSQVDLKPFLHDLKNERQQKEVKKIIEPSSDLLKLKTTSKKEVVLSVSEEDMTQTKQLGKILQKELRDFEKDKSLVRTQKGDVTHSRFSHLQEEYTNHKEIKDKNKFEANQNTDRYSKSLIKNKVSFLLVAVVVFIFLYKKELLFFKSHTNSQGNSIDLDFKSRDESELPNRHISHAEIMKYKLKIDGYDWKSHRVYLNGKKIELDVFGEGELEINKTPSFVFLRLEESGFKNRVFRLDRNYLDSVVSKKIIWKLPAKESQKWGYLTFGKCFEGVVIYKLHDEEIEILVQFNTRISLPVGESVRLTLRDKNGRETVRKSIHVDGEHKEIKYCELGG